METQTKRPGRPRRAQKGVRRYAQVTVHLPPDLCQDLDAQAEREGIETRSALVRKALGEYLRRAAKRAESATSTG